jgi:putative ABC transport system substrate-binding protein
MRRRQFVAGFGAAVAAGLSPFTAQAQQDSRLRRVGVLMGLVQDEPEGQARMQAFRQGLADFGWVEGRIILMSAGPDWIFSASRAMRATSSRWRPRLS